MSNTSGVKDKQQLNNSGSESKTTVEQLPGPSSRRVKQQLGNCCLDMCQSVKQQLGNFCQHMGTSEVKVKEQLNHVGR